MQIAYFRREKKSICCQKKEKKLPNLIVFASEIAKKLDFPLQNLHYYYLYKKGEPGGNFQTLESGVINS